MSKMDSIGETDGEQEAPLPSSQAEGDVSNKDGDNKKGGKKKKRKKLKRKKPTKDEKAKARMMKKMQALMKDTEAYHRYIDKIDHWMVHNHRKVANFFGRLDDDEEGTVPVDIFKSGLRDLDCPVTDLEFNMLMAHLDPTDRGVVPYTRFDRGFVGHRGNGDEESDDDGHQRADDYRPAMYSRSEEKRCSSRNHPYNMQTARFIELEMRLATFNHLHEHPCHVTVRAHTSMTVSELCKTVAKTSRVITGEMNIYTSSGCDGSERLPTEATLGECGMQGGPHRAPVRATLYYDYAIEFSDCSLLACDHYFDHRSSDAPLNPVLTAYIKTD